MKLTILSVVSDRCSPVANQIITLNICSPLDLLLLILVSPQYPVMPLSAVLQVIPLSRRLRAPAACPLRLNSFLTHFDKISPVLLVKVRIGSLSADLTAPPAREPSTHVLLHLQAALCSSINTFNIRHFYNTGPAFVFCFFFGVNLLFSMI